METYPGLPTPIVADHLSRDAAEQIYGPGITFQIGLVTLCTNTGTYLDVPFHRFADGHDLTGLALERVAAVPAVRLDRRGQKAIELDDLDVSELAGHAVLVWTGRSPVPSVASMLSVSMPTQATPAASNRSAAPPVSAG